MRFGLVPIGNRRDIVREWLELPIWPPSKRLDRDFQIALKSNWIHYVPPIEGMFWHLSRLLAFERIT
jgi:hypothetical protein